MPYYDIPGHEGKPVTRNTEAIRTLDCQGPAWYDHNHKKKFERKLYQNWWAVCGTLMHHNIECILAEFAGMEKPLFQWQNQEEARIYRFEMRGNDTRFIERYDRCMANFRRWFEEKKDRIKVLYLEKRFWSLDPNIVAAGTVDLICLMKVSGEWQITFVDWKSGYKFYPHYGPQLAGYNTWAKQWHEAGKLIMPQKKWNRKVLNVIFGNTEYKEKWSRLDFDEWKKGYDTYQNPKKECSGETCTFCGDIFRCDHPNPRAYKNSIKDILLREQFFALEGMKYDTAEMYA